MLSYITYILTNPFFPNVILLINSFVHRKSTDVFGITGFVVGFGAFKNNARHYGRYFVGCAMAI